MIARALAATLAANQLPPLHRPRWGVILVVALMLVAALASTAWAASAAAGPTVSVAPQSDAVAGRPMILQVTGTIPVEDLWYPYYFSAEVIPTTALSTCPTDHWAASQVASITGQVLTRTQREQPDAAGNFSFPLGFTPWAPGDFLVCAYTDDGQMLTLATSSHLLNVQPAPSTQPAAPRAGIAATARAEIRGCLALLGRSHRKSCVRDAVRRGNARCRRLHSRGSRTRCVRGVRRVARQYS